MASRPLVGNQPLGAISSTAAKAGENGLILLSCGVNANTLRFLMPLTADDKIINEDFDILEKTIAQAVEGATKAA